MQVGPAGFKSRVQVRDAEYDESHVQYVRQAKRLRYKVSGVVYLVFTACCSIMYIVLVSPSMSNDHWWPQFDASTTQTFLGDLYNFVLTTPLRGDFDLFATTSMVRKDYSSPTTFIGIQSSVSRALLLRPLALDAVVPIIRSVDLFENMRTLPPPCWLDFNRTYEMAHTARHQVLCNERRPSNAALYLEALLRNVASTDITSSLFMQQLQVSIFDAVMATPDGAAWAAAILNHTWLPVADEVAHWHAHGLSYYQNQLQNLFHESYRNSITIVNALGMRANVTIHNIPFENRPKGAWSTGYAFCGFWNDLEGAMWTASSLIRSAPNAFEAMGNDWDTYYCGSTGVTATTLVRTNLGPLTTIDIYMVSIPASLGALYASFLDELHRAVFLHPTGYLNTTEPQLEVVPGRWKRPNAVYYGGNPMCCYGNPMPYVQPSFGYYDDCGTQDRHEIAMTRASVLFAMFATGIASHQLAAVCDLTTSAAMFTTCMQTMVPAYDVFTSVLGGPASPLQSLAPLVVQTTQDVVPLNVSFVQWATIDGVDQVLHQAMVSSGGGWTDPWSFFGWMTLFEWANGQREVFSFEGDYDTYVLMTRPNPIVELAANPLELPRSACGYLWAMLCYISAVLVAVIGLILLYSAKAGFNIDGRNLFQVNRLIGGSWVGRPFLFLRGMTAILVLSTSNVSLTTSFGAMSKLAFVRRSVWEIFLLAGEVSWVTYALNDVFLPLTQPHSSMYSVTSSVMTWVAVVLVETTSPFRARASVATDCVVASFMRGLQCTSGEIHIGTMERTCLYLALVPAATVISYVGVVLVSKIGAPRPRPHEVPPNVLLASTSEAFLAHPVHEFTSLDAAACVMSGILPFRDATSLFDIKIWVAFQAECIGDMTYCLLPAALDVRPLDQNEVARRRRALHGIPTQKSPFQIRAVGFIGLTYMVGAVVLSFFFLNITRTTLVNDFVWVGFKESKIQVFLSNWFNAHLQMAHPTVHVQVDSGGYGDFATANNSTKINVVSSALYAIAVQDEVNTLTNVVHGLRIMDSCLLPWIATAYCFADLGWMYEMAHSTARQVRCRQQELDNGAVYLETVFGNANWATLRSCWGKALDVAVFSSVRSTREGSAWVQSLQWNRRSEADEVAMWQARGITRFHTQWQNYKHLGMAESFLVANAFGLRYPLTLKKSTTSFHIPSATAFKMYWSFANDLTAVMAAANGSSVMGGKSLLRQSATYAFRNASIADAMAEQGVLVYPLDGVLSEFHDNIGPFGTVDMVRVGCPRVLLDHYRSLHRRLLATVSTGNGGVQAAFWDMYAYNMYSPTPAAWDGLRLWGGDINCGVNYGGWAMAPFQFFSSNGICGNFLTDFLGVTAANSVLATLSMEGLTNNETADVARFGSRDLVNLDTISTAVNTSFVFGQTFFTRNERAEMLSTGRTVKQYIRDTIQLELVHYVSADNDLSPIEMSRVNVFDPTEPDFEYFAWFYLFDWVEGKREVVTFQGDHGQVTTVSAVQNFVERPVDAQEVPVNVSLYFLALVQYITIVLCGVGCVVCVYIVSNRGYIEGVNMMSFSLVAGHVWIGRPLMLLRGLTAICFLSTAKLNLVRPHQGLVSYFDSPDRSWFMTLLSSGEMAWLVNVIHDTCSVLTREYTAGCFSKSALIVCVSAAIWSFASPTRHSVTILRDCRVVAVDFEAACVSGVVQIGDFTRFCGLIGLALVGCLLSYVIERLRHSTPPPTLGWQSFFLYSAAKHKFERTIQLNWEYGGVYYLDKASAALTGVLSFEYGGSLHILDIKTWRLYAISPTQLAARGRNIPPHLSHAIPLVE